MKIASKLLVTLSLAVIPGSIFAQNQIPTDSQPPGPEIEVVDGKITMSALGVPLGRIVTLVDRAMGFQSKVAPEVANRNVSVRIKDLPVKDAFVKILEGQPVNYILIEGKGISVTGLAQGAATTTGSSFSEPPPVSQNPLPNMSPIQPGNPAQGNPNQPVIINAPFPGTGAPANANPANANPAASANPNALPVNTAVPGQMPPPIGANAPPIPILAQPAAGLPVVPAPQQQPAGPGTLGATPGAIR
ncbi:MAG TPA: hypothetical protein VFR18_05350 [Terriglobia bacterium]|nr:hypothetical protein [Terriglobia bacterium]